MRAKPVLTLSLLAIALALPGTGAALGLGKLTVNSALGQPLSAQIELTSAAKEELDSLAARIADPSLYRQNNLTYPGALSRARVSLERAANGEPYLKITTQLPVSEPFLDLLQLCRRRIDAVGIPAQKDREILELRLDAVPSIEIRLELRIQVPEL